MTVVGGGRATRVSAANDHPDAFRRHLVQLFRVIIDGYMTGETGPSGCIMVSTSTTSAVDDEDVRARLAAFLKLEDDKIEELLIARGDPAARMHARLASAVIHSLSARARAGASREELDEMAAECVAMIVGG